jgi:four helix bundle protein
VSADKIQSWHDLQVWQQAHAATLEVYHLTKAFPADERYRLTDQLCRAASSVPTNIAEGKGRGSLAEFCQFLTIARGSIEETRYLLCCSRRTSACSLPKPTPVLRQNTPKFPR